MKMYKVISPLILCTLIVLSSCDILSGTSEKINSNNKTSNSTRTESVLSDILNTVMGKAPLTYKNMVGTWNFNKSAVAFETDNLLKKAGGTVVASQVQAKLDESSKSLGINSNNTTFTFNADSTYSAKLRGIKISGKYTIDAKTKQVRMSYLMGVAHLNATAAVSSRNMKLLFDADSFLKLMKFLSQFTNNTSIEVLGKMADMYDGMLMGFDMKKE
ncbi:MAG: DUF4923 family protein [Bacteroidales bacterium]|nr:DUF4923 family protein [Bacteroidales bacterium]